jgi:hypothetical protein
MFWLQVIAGRQPIGGFGPAQPTWDGSKQLGDLTNVSMLGNAPRLKERLLNDMRPLPQPSPFQREEQPQSLSSLWKGEE